MLTDEDIIIISSLDFGRVWGSRENYAIEFSNNNRVFFINPHYGVEHLLKRKWIREYRKKKKNHFINIIKTCLSSLHPLLYQLVDIVY